MTTEEMERAIEFLLDHHARFSTDIGELREAIGELKDAQKRQGETVAQMISEMETDRRETREVLNNMITEIRDGFNNLIVANEVSRHLAEEATRLAIQTSQRVTGLDRRVTDLEQRQ
jgi:hypothetical protein